VISDLHLREIGKETVSVATEERTVSTYLFRIGLFPDGPDRAPIPYVFSDLTGFRLKHRTDFDVLIGMDVLRQTTFVTRSNQTWQLSFGNT